MLLCIFAAPVVCAAQSVSAATDARSPDTAPYAAATALASGWSWDSAAGDPMSGGAGNTVVDPDWSWDTQAETAVYPEAGTGGDLLWSNACTDTLQTGVKAYYVIFDLEQDSVIETIVTWHQPGAAGTGEIMLSAANGDQWGPFQTVGTEPDSRTEYVCRVADTGQLLLAAGRYAIADSSPSTWLCSPDTEYRGIAEVTGHPQYEDFQTNPFTSMD